MTTEDENNLNGSSRTTRQAINIMLVGGLLITLIGLYLTIVNNSASGYSGSDEIGNPGHTQTINGPSALFLGLALLVYPIYSIFKNRREQKNNS